MALRSGKICVESMARYSLSYTNYTSSRRRVWVLGGGRRGGQSTGPLLLRKPGQMQAMLVFRRLLGMSTLGLIQVRSERHGIRLAIGEGLWVWGVLSSHRLPLSF